MKKEEFDLNGQVIADLYYRDDKEKEMAPFQNLTKEYHKLIDFFGVQPPKIKIQLLYDREEMDKHWGTKSPSWLQAMVDNHDPYLIYIFSPLVFEKVTKKKKEEILPTIVHEAAHTFVSEMNDRCFAWANEGICEFVTGKDSYGKIEKDNWLWFKNNDVLFDPAIDWSELTGHQGYAISYRLIKYIVEKYGKDAVFSIIRIKRVPDKDLKKKMGQLLGGSFDRFVEDFEDTIKAQGKRLERMKNRKGRYKTEVHGKEFIVLPRVFYPGTDSVLMIETVLFDPEDIVLDSCAGTGIFSVFAANKAKKVIAVDVNKFAIENVKENTKLYKLGDKITAIVGDLFPDFEIKFDKISINPPYTDNFATDVVERSVWDKGNKTTRKFFKKVKDYLKPDGKIYLSWANFADYDFIENLIKESGFSFKVIRKSGEGERNYRIYEIQQKPLIR